MTRQIFNQALNELRDDILLMGSKVSEQLHVSLAALRQLDLERANEVNALDRQVNELRFEIEDRCLLLIVTQQPAAGDLRLIFAAINMIVDLERMGDQTKGIAKVIPVLKRYPTLRQPVELQSMGQMGDSMLQDALKAYTEGDVDLAQEVITRDDDVDGLFARVFTQIMFTLAQESDPERVQAIYDMLRVARELERFADLAANFAERSIFLVTGTMPAAGGGA